MSLPVTGTLPRFGEGMGERSAAVGFPAELVDRMHDGGISRLVRERGEGAGRAFRWLAAHESRNLSGGARIVRRPSAC